METVAKLILGVS